MTPTPLGFIEVGMLVVEGVAVSNARAMFERHPRARHHPLPTYRVVRWDRFASTSEGAAVWHYQLEHVNVERVHGGPVIGHAAGPASGIFAGHVFRPLPNRV